VEFCLNVVLNSFASLCSLRKVRIMNACHPACFYLCNWYQVHTPKLCVEFLVGEKYWSRYARSWRSCSQIL
jgi:hypothetical protein